ncbi:MAG: diguanylate cyclase [Candidatus Micrarchaeia archaeon]|jgi:diguanylate cyclase (GGDEF)-like protein
MAVRFGKAVKLGGIAAAAGAAGYLAGRKRGSAERKALKKESRIDSLTKLYNRTHFDEQVANFVKASSRDGPLSMIMVDVDELKFQNDAFGHAKGDGLLKTVGGVLQKSGRAGDVHFRLGGDEFAMLLPNTDAKGAKVVEGKIHENLAAIRGNYVRASTGSHTINVSGRLSAEQAKALSNTLLEEADERMKPMKALRKAAIEHALQAENGTSSALNRFVATVNGNAALRRHVSEIAPKEGGDYLRGVFMDKWRRIAKLRGTDYFDAYLKAHRARP